MSCRITRYVPCDCHKLDYCRTKCIRNVKYSVCRKYKPENTRCSKYLTYNFGNSKCFKYLTYKIPIVERCSPQRHHQCKLLNYLINNCYFKSCQTSFYIYQGCRCVRHTETTEACFECPKLIRKTYCKHNRRVVRTINFIRRPNRCDPVITEQIIHIACPRWRVIRTNKHGYTHYKLTYYKIENCKCVPRICHGPYFKKKCPFSKLKRRCSRNNQWIYTRIVRQIHFTHRRFCPEVNSGLREQICIETRKTRIVPIRCPHRHIIITCIVSRNIKRTEIHYYKVVNCRCVKAVIVEKKYPCKECRKPIVRRSKCGPLDENGIGYITVTTRYWTITRKNKCKHHIKISKIIGCCRPNRKTKECVNGKIIFKTFIYQVPFQCKPKIKIDSVSVPCYNNGRPNKWRIVRVHYCTRPGGYMIKYLERMKFNPSNCDCIFDKKTVNIDICCKPCKYRTECRHNNKIVVIASCQRPKNLKCVNYNIEKILYIKCPSRKREVIGDCKGKVIRYRVVSYKSIQCRCVKSIKTYVQHKIPDDTRCIGKRWRTTHVAYELYRHRCVPRPPIITYKSIICSPVVTFKDEKINQCDFSRAYFKQFVSNCKCVDKLVRQEILHYKCCEKIKPRETCSKHNTRVIIKTTFHLVDFKCIPVRIVCRYPVDCSHLKLKERIQTGPCTFKIVKYFAVTQNCKCYRKHKVTYRDLRSSCCGLKPYTTRYCDKILGRIVITYISYELVNYKCPQKISNKYIPINCDGKICERRFGRCIRNTQTIELFCLKRQGCKCVKTIFRQYNVCCGPKKDSIWTKNGKCHIRYNHIYQLVNTYVLRLHPIKNQCRPVIVKQQYRLCRCRDPFVQKLCINNNYIKTIKIFYKKDIPKNVCHKIVNDSLSPIERCHKTVKIKMNEMETTPEGWCIRTTKIITPVNCKCIERIEKTRIWCPCYKPVPVLRKRYCENNNIIDETRTPICRLYTIYWKIVKRVIPIFNCSRIQILYGKDFHYLSYGYRRRFYYGFPKRFRNKGKRKYCTRARYETHLQWYLYDCKCRSKVIKKKLKCTKCRAPRQKEKCLISKKIITSYSYSLFDGICRKHINRRTINIPCPNRPKVHQSRCFNNKYTITTTHYFYDNCRCRSRVERRICDCQCLRDTTRRQCSRNYFWIEITTKYHKNSCRCFKSENVKRFEPICPRFNPISIGSCQVKKGYSIYQKVTRRHIRKYYRTCECSVREDIKYKICRCGKKITTRKVCINNNIVQQTWIWKINAHKNRCEKVLSKYMVQVFTCPPPIEIKDCNYDISRGTKTTIKYFKVHCKCVKHKFVKPIHCPCKTNPVLVDRGKCSDNCRRISIYKRKEARGKHCVTIKERKIVPCCCRKRDKLFNFCRYDRFVTVQITYKFISNDKLSLYYCQKRKNVKYANINCSSNVTKKESQCYRYGYKIISYYRLFVQNCKCIQRRFRVEFCRCRCPQNRIIVRCAKSGKAVINIQYTYQLIGCRCIARKTKNIRQIQCPSSNVLVSQCNEVRCKVFWFRTTKITSYHVRHCMCVSVVKTTKSICKVNEYNEVSESCDNIKRMIVRKESKLIYERSKCVKVTKVIRTPIVCDNNWRIANKPVCRYDGLFGSEIRIYERLVYRNCGCHLETKIKRCNCRCTGPSMTRKCEGGIIRKYFYQYKLGRCKCRRKLIKEKTERIHCENKQPKIGPCLREGNRCVRYVEYRDSIVSNCQCIERRRTVKRVCYSCCDKSDTTRQYCSELLNKLITRITGCRVTFYGHIRENVQIKEQDVPCEVGRICVSNKVYDKISFSETLKCTITSIQKCVCVSRTETIKRHGCICKPARIKFGKCDRNSCIREVYEVESQLLALRNDEKTCQDVKRKIRDEVCCCPEFRITKQCVNNKLIQNTRRYTFNEAKKICVSNINEIDITESCEPAVENIPDICNLNTCTRKIITITRKLVGCKCRTTKSIKTESCCCPKDRTETKCVGNRFETTSYKYSMENEERKCTQTVSKSSKSVECPALDTNSFRFNIYDLDNCKRTIYEVKNCQCIPVVTTQFCVCSLKCPKDTVTELCIPEKGVYRIVNKNYKFEKEGCKCIENIKFDDKQIKCAETPRNEISKASSIHDNGIYDIVTTFSERRDQCECIKQSSSRFILNKCFDNYRKSAIGNANGLYDYKCEKIPDSPPPPPVVCPDNSTINLGNGRSKVTYFVIEGNRCVEKTTEKTCDTCKIQYCVEDSSVCDPNKCSDSSHRALCPIKCGVCVECTSNESNCETNPFDDKQYKKKT